MKKLSVKSLSRAKDDLTEDLKDPQFKTAYERERFFASIAIQVAKMREANGLTQAQLARQLQISQQAVSHLEQSSSARYSLTTLLKLAETFHKKLKVQFI